MPMQSPSWTEERLALLTAMRESGPKIIWEALNKLRGPKLTKSAVIGKRDRMFGFKKPVKTEEEKAAARAASRERDAAKKRENRERERLSLGIGPQVQAINRGPKIKVERFKPRAAGVVSQCKPLLDLRAMECRWPDEERNADGLHTFCGHATLDGQSYCDAHRELSHGTGTASERAADRTARSIARAA